MLDESLIGPLVAAVGHAPWPVLVGLLMIVLVGAARWLTHGRLRGRAASWASATAALLGGVGVALAAGGVWWQALLVALLAAPTSSGFWRLVRSSIPISGGP